MCVQLEALLGCDAGYLLSALGRTTLFVAQDAPRGGKQGSVTGVLVVERIESGYRLGPAAAGAAAAGQGAAEVEQPCGGRWPIKAACGVRALWTAEPCSATGSGAQPSSSSRGAVAGAGVVGVAMASQLLDLARSCLYPGWVVPLSMVGAGWLGLPSAAAACHHSYGTTTCDVM